MARSPISVRSQANILAAKGQTEIANALITLEHGLNAIEERSKSAERLVTGTFVVGGANQLDPRVIVKDGYGNWIGFIGMDADGNQGAWFKTISIGGSGFSSGVVKSDLSGNITINGATLVLNSSNVVTQIANILVDGYVCGFTSWNSSTNVLTTIAPGWVAYYNEDLVWCGSFAITADHRAGILQLADGTGTGSLGSGKKVILTGSDGKVQMGSFEVDRNIGTTYPNFKNMTATTAASGGGSAVPGGTSGYLKVLVDGNEKRIPYFEV